MQPAVRWLDQYVDVDALALERLRRRSPAGMERGDRRADADVRRRRRSTRWCRRCSSSSRCSISSATREPLRDALYDIVPLEYEQSHDIVLRTREVIGATIYGVLAISAIQGVLGFLIFFLLGLPSPLLWGVVMFLMSMIPMAGAFVVWVPAALYLLLTGSYVKAILLAVWGVLVIGSIDNFLSPRLVGRRARLHELLIFFSVLGGLQVFGVLGLVLGPVLAAITLALIEVVRQANRPPSRDAEGDDGDRGAGGNPRDRLRSTGACNLEQLPGCPVAVGSHSMPAIMTRLLTLLIVGWTTSGAAAASAQSASGATQTSAGWEPRAPQSRSSATPGTEHVGDCCGSTRTPSRWKVSGGRLPSIVARSRGSISAETR